MKVQTWLDINCPQEQRSKIQEIYLNEPNIEGELDCSDFACEWLRVYISSTVDSNQIVIKNLPEKGKIIQLISAPEWLEQNYPKNGVCQRKTEDKSWFGDKEGGWNNLGKTRSEITKLDISRQNLEEDLDLSDFVNLKVLNCCGNKLTFLNLSNCSQLEKINCSSNQLANLTLPSNPTKLKGLYLSYNNFANQDLSFLLPATNLKELWLGNTHFTGSLDYLSEMKCLWRLNIRNTDINEVNIDKLPRSLEMIYYSNADRPNCQLTKIIPQLEKCEWGWCKKCQQPNTSQKCCHSCAEQEWQQDLKELTSQEVVEKFIQQQGQDWQGNYKLQWIPYQEFTNIEYLAEGGFSKVYKAEWGKDRHGNERMVVLKSLTNSQNITLDFLQEIANTKLVDKDFYIVPCHGISQDLATKDYLMVMGYMSEGNLRQYLKNNFGKLTWWEKLRKLESIAYGLKNIHNQNLVHRDLHGGNILNGWNNDWNDYLTFITGLGLSRPANSQKKEGEIFGVIPYVAPEVLQGQPYTQAADIYSFGIIAAEMITGLPPYYDREHDQFLALDICQGLRPQFQIKIPPLLEKLINRCWDADPEQRPSAEELKKILDGWHNEIKDNKNTQFAQQIQAAETYNQTLPEAIRFPKYQLHLGAVYHSKLINTQQITNLLSTAISELYTDAIDLDIAGLNLTDNKTEQLENQIEMPPKTGN